MSVVVKRPVGRELAATARSMGMRACPACGMWCTEAEADCTSCGRAVQPLAESTPIADQLDREFAAARSIEVARANFAARAQAHAAAEAEARLQRQVRKACRRERRRELMRGWSVLLGCALVLVALAVVLTLMGRWS